MEDMALLREYAASNSEEAFRTLVDRHLDMVYATAFRQVNDRELAEEVTQAVFIALARKASSIAKATILAGWLFRAARFAATKAARGEARRRRWEQEAAQMEHEPSTSESLWEQIAPLLNDALAQLSEVDRCAVILRFFESKSFQQIGSALGTTEAAAKMRLSRAMEKLRLIFQKRGVVVPAAGLFAALSAHSAQAAPPGLASAISAAALLKTATTSTLMKGILIMASTKQKIGLAAAVTALLLTGGTTTGYVIYRIVRSGHPAEAARGNVPPPAVASPEPVTVAFSDDQTPDQKKRAEAGVWRAQRRIVNVQPQPGAPAESGDVMVFDVNGGTNADGTVFRTKARAVVRRSGTRAQGLAPGLPDGSADASGGGYGTAPGAPRAGGNVGGPSYGIGRAPAAPVPAAPTPVPPPEQ